MTLSALKSAFAPVTAKPALLAALLTALLGATGTAAFAGKPAALVEDAPAGLKDVQVMDYVEEGKAIRLDGGQQLVLSYLESCVRETITGGTVTVGHSESTVEQGSVARESLPCDGGQLLLSAADAGKSGAQSFRSFHMDEDVPKPQITLYKTRPMLVSTAPGHIVFERLDRKGEVLEVDIPGKRLDLAATSLRLAPGGLYKVALGDRHYVVKVDPAARDEGGPVLGRLIRF